MSRSQGRLPAAVYEDNEGVGCLYMDMGQSDAEHNCSRVRLKDSSASRSLNSYRDIICRHVSVFLKRLSSSSTAFTSSKESLLNVNAPQLLTGSPSMTGSAKSAAASTRLSLAAS